MSVFGPFPFSTKTEYRAEYTPKKLKWAYNEKPYLEGHIFLSTTAFPINLPERPKRIESFRQKVRCQSAATEKLLSKGIDPSIVNLSEKPPKSTYVIDYSHGRVPQDDLMKYSLPDGWITPETTQKCSYRPPKIWFNEEIKSLPLPRPQSHFQPNENEREILGVKTGDTDYSEIIGKTGAWIKETKYLGDVSIRPKFDVEDLEKVKTLKKDNL